MRASSIDILRMFAMVVMVYVHFSENLAGVTPRIAGLGAPTFLFLVGVSYRLWLNGRLRRGASDESIRRTTLRRGAFLFVLGVVFNVLVWTPEDIFNWDVLTLVGMAMFVLEVARRLPVGLAVFFAAVVLAISPAARAVADFPAYWTNGYFDPDWNVRDPLLGLLSIGYFPILPWIAIPVAGFAAGTFVFGESAPDGGDLDSARRLTVAGGLLVVGVAAAIGMRQLWPELFSTVLKPTWTMFPATTMYVLGAIGFVSLGFGGLYLWVDRKLGPERLPWLRSVASTFSRHSLTVYLLHHLIHVWPMWAYAIARGEETTVHWRQAMSLPLALVFATLFLPCAYVLFRWMDQTGRGGVEAWMRRVCD
ncbi:MAG: heparan-alpha-glucosaminide N-acetyltransferase domain-containing protein [Pirellulales bacterium]